MRNDAGSEAALIHKPPQRSPAILKCTHCGRRGQLEDRCLDKYPEKRPNRLNTRSKSQAFPAEEYKRRVVEPENPEQVVCRMATTGEPIQQELALILS